jgi:RNA polymerase sporulation-specific sigma factor
MRRHERIATGEATAFYMIGHTYHDVEQEARIGLLRAVREYDADRGVPFSGYARLSIRRALITAIIASQREKHIHLNDSARYGTNDEGEELAAVELLHAPGADPADIAEQREELARMARGVAGLSALERRALVGYLNGLTYAQIGNEQSIDNALQRARLKVRRAA